MIGQEIIDSRKTLKVPDPSSLKEEAEGGCGVVGLASNIPLEGKYLLESLVQMRNRGNGKGGGIAALGLVPEQLPPESPTLLVTRREESVRCLSRQEPDRSETGRLRR